MLKVFIPPAADPELFDVVIRRPDGTDEVSQRHVSENAATGYISIYNQISYVTGSRAYMRICRCRWDD